jgi:hypothetical protein
MSGLRAGTCGDPGPHAAHCTEHPGHRYSCYDAGDDVSFNDGTTADSDAFHACDSADCPDREAQYTQLRDGERLHLWCPGCEDLHVVIVGLDAHDQPLWTWDGNTTQPTISPSILVNGEDSGHPTVCHSFLKAGCWEFLADSTHELAGQTADVVPLPLWLVREGSR